MTNANKFIDRAPELYAAGKPCIQNHSIKEVLQEYSLVDSVDALKHEKNIFNEKDTPLYKQQKLRNVGHRGIHSEISEKWISPVKTRYENLIDDLKETSYASYWKQKLGRCPDEIPAFPAGFQLEEVTFGKPSLKGPSVKDIIFPPLNRYEVLWNSQINHDNYKKIYNSYNPGEKITRSYLEPFNANKCAGCVTKYDKRGMGTKCSLKSFQTDRFTLASTQKVDYKNRYGIKLGKSLTPINCINLVPQDFSFGKATDRPLFNVEELLKEYLPGFLKKDMLSCLAALNTLRQTIKKLYGPTFSLHDLLFRFSPYDQECLGKISLYHFYAVMNCLNINFHREKLEKLFRAVGIIENNTIDYKKFIDALQFKMEFEVQLDQLPQEMLKNYISQSRYADLDYLVIDNSKMAPAGIPTIPVDLPKHVKSNNTPLTGIQPDTVQCLTKHSIFYGYGISYADMFEPRTKQFMHSLFKNAGFELSSDVFNSLYETALKIDGNNSGMVSVETFYNLVKQHQLQKSDLNISNDLISDSKTPLKSCQCKENSS